MRSRRFRNDEHKLETSPRLLVVVIRTADQKTRTDEIRECQAIVMDYLARTSMSDLVIAQCTSRYLRETDGWSSFGVCCQSLDASLSLPRSDGSDVGS